MNRATRIAGLTVALMSAFLLVLRDEMFKPELPPAFKVPMISNSATNGPAHSSDFLPSIADAPSVHAPSLWENSEGQLFAVWWGGSREGADDVRIFLSKAGSVTWTPPKPIMSREQAARELRRPIRRIGNAVICSRSANDLTVLFVTTTIGGWSTASLNMIQSSDAGQTWSRAERFHISPLLNISELVRSQPIAYGKGFIVPIYHELAGKFPELLWLETKNLSEFSYRKTKAFGGRTAFQPSIAAVTGTRIVMALRDPKSRNLFVTWSTDGGETFSEPTRSDLPNPNAAVDIIALPNNRLLLAHNNSKEGRHNMALSISNDDGITWKLARVIEDEPNAEFSYPALHLARDGNIHLAYTWKRERIRHHTFNMEWLEK